MAKIITTIAVENGMDFDEICSFETENYVGIWCHAHDKFMLATKSDMEFYSIFLNTSKDLKELDDEVYKEINEHIMEVYDTSDYDFILNVNRKD